MSKIGEGVQNAASAKAPTLRRVEEAEALDGCGCGCGAADPHGVILRPSHAATNGACGGNAPVTHDSLLSCQNRAVKLPPIVQPRWVPHRHHGRSSLAGMKLIIQIPCLNEEASLPATLAALPRTVRGIETIEVVVIDDGSHDKTAEVAERLGAKVVRVPATRGLGHAFMTGILTALGRGADVIVNTDGDNQYAGADIDKLIAPIVRGEADMVIGSRPIDAVESFSSTKRLLERVGSWTVGKLSGSRVADATSGFRAFSREAALRLNVFSRYTYTLETIVQASRQDLRIVSVPISVNPALRPSRLLRSNLGYVLRSGSGLLRMSIVYRPFRFFMIPAIATFVIATAIGLRFLGYFVVSRGAPGHLQSLVLAAIFYVISVSLAVVAFVGDLLAINRRLLEDLQLRARRLRLDLVRKPDRESIIVKFDD